MNNGPGPHYAGLVAFVLRQPVGLRVKVTLTIAQFTYAELLERLWGLQIVDNFAHLPRKARPRR